MSTTALTIVVGILTALVITLGVAVHLLRREVHGMRIESGTARSVADALRDGRDEDAVRELLEYLESAHGRMAALSQHARALDETLERFRERAKGHLQRVGVVRFDASDDVSGNLSCALCVLDGHNAGFLITTLYDLSGSRTFVRAVRDGKTDRELLPEEAEALKAALAAPAGRAPGPDSAARPAVAAPAEPTPESSAKASEESDDA